MPKNSTVVRSRHTVRLIRTALHAAYAISEDLGTSLAERMFTTPRRHARPRRETAILASARDVAFEVTLRSPRWHGDRRTLVGWRWGFGPTVLLVHGWEGRGSQLGAFVAPLVAAGLSVVAFDAPGHGDSPDHALYLTDLADCVGDVAHAAGPLHGIVAHSFGAAAVLLARARGGVSAPRNVMLAPNVIIEDAFARFARLVGLDELDRTALERRIAEHAGVSLEALALDRLTAGCDTALLVVHDRDDREIPLAHGERLAATWPSAQLRTTEALGHRRILRDPDVIARTVAFVREGVPAPASDLVREVDRWLGAGAS
ncbi:MAG TPA: alpha/beta fold hydrolase [Kofleriaceae bacterium]|nr:alpha/beta fold hydrolase [Kofleriaceae bacterium]